MTAFHSTDIEGGRASRLKKGDMVIVGAGRDRGKRGKISQVFPERNRAVVEKVNLIKRHMRPTKAYPQGGIVEKEASIHISNLRYVCPHCDKPVRLGVVKEKDSRRRVCRKCGKDVK